MLPDFCIKGERNRTWELFYESMTFTSAMEEKPSIN
jgi:hypothetical protein